MISAGGERYGQDGEGSYGFHMQPSRADTAPFSASPCTLVVALGISVPGSGHRGVEIGAVTSISGLCPR